MAKNLMIQAGCKGKCNPGKSCGMWAGSSIHSSRDLPPTQKAEDHSESSTVQELAKEQIKQPLHRSAFLLVSRNQLPPAITQLPTTRCPTLQSSKKKFCLPAPVSASHSSSKRQRVKPSAAKTSLQGICIRASVAIG